MEMLEMNREERKCFLENNKPELSDNMLDAVNNDCGTEVENPDSDCPYKGNWISSEGFVCKGEVQC